MKVLCGDLDGWNWEGGPGLGGYIYTHIADSPFCMVETNTVL